MKLPFAFATESVRPLQRYGLTVWRLNAETDAPIMLGTSFTLTHDPDIIAEVMRLAGLDVHAAHVLDGRDDQVMILGPALDRGLIAQALNTNYSELPSHIYDKAAARMLGKAILKQNADLPITFFRIVPDSATRPAAMRPESDDPIPSFLQDASRSGPTPEPPLLQRITKMVRRR